MLKALRNRPISLLWGGQALSAIGDEIYRVALIWLAVGLIGKDTGYLAASQCAALLTLSLIAGKWADHWDHFRTMIWVDALRAVIVLIPVVLVHFIPLTLPMLLAVALTVSALGAFFDPALQAALPRFSPDLETLQAATGLMSTTMRLARVMGPAIIGVLTPFIPLIHFFTLDAASFGVSALSVRAVRRCSPRRTIPPRQIKRQSFRETLVSGFRAIRTRENMPYITFAKTSVGGAWSLAYSLGLVLLARELVPNDVRAFGLVVAAYGIGNVGSALILGNLPRRRPAFIMFLGYTWMGVGLLFVAVSPSLKFLMLAAGFTAIGGPMNDLPFVDIVQAQFPIDEIPKIFRLRMALETGGTLVAMLVSPALFRLMSVSIVIGLCGLVSLVVGVVGLARFSEGVLEESGSLAGVQSE